jgi:agmatinase
MERTGIVNYLSGEPHTFGAIDPEDYPYEKSKIAVLPIPYEATTSFGRGTGGGPREIIQASRYMELYDDETKQDVSERGIYTLPDVASVVSSPADMVEGIYEAAKSVLEDDKFLVSLGGEHTITPPLVKAHLEKHAGLSVLQIDAHADLRDSYEGSKYSHACAMRRVLELTRAVQVGIRSISAEEVGALPSLPTRLVHAHEIRSNPNWRDEVVEALIGPVYVTIDLDGLDPSIMPAVGTPEPGGLDWYQVCELLKEVATRHDVVGFDVNELAPIPGLTAPNFLAAKLVYKLLSHVFVGA